MKTQITALPKLFIGIDIHKRSWKIHCSTDLFAGKSFTMPPDPEKLREYVQKHFPDHEVSTAYEAGCCDYSAHRSFESFGIVKEKNVIPQLVESMPSSPYVRLMLLIFLLPL